MSKLDDARSKINAIDNEMAHLFEKRMHAAAVVAAYKEAHGLPILDNAREAQVISRNASLIEDEAVREHYITFLKNTIAVSRAYQEQLLFGMRVAYSGVEGAFAHIAARRIYPAGKTVAYKGFAEAYRAVEQGECHCAVLPIENSSAGEVGQVVDLLFNGSLHVSGVYDLAVRHQLMALPGANAANIRRVYSHPQALEQCAPHLRRHGFETVSCINTAMAAKQVAESGDLTVAAIASDETAELYGLQVLQRNINESANNTTRFAVVVRSESRPEEERDMRTMLFFSVSHQAGSLAGAIGIIAKHGFNMVSLRSRAQKDLLWQYYMAVELEGNAYSSAGQAMMAELAECCDKLKIVGVFQKDRCIDAFEEE